MTIACELTGAVTDLIDASVTTMKGFLVTVKHLVKPSEIVTIQYPHQRLEIAPAFRGKFTFDPGLCSVCTMCVRVCPTGCIKINHVLGADKKRILTSYSLDMTTCLFCGLCVKACPSGSGEICKQGLRMTGEYEYSSERKETISFEYVVPKEQLDEQLRKAEENEKLRQEKLSKLKAAGPNPVVPGAKPSADTTAKPAVPGANPVVPGSNPGDTKP